MAHPLPPKKEVALALLEQSSVFVHLDPRKPGVVVPPHFRDRPQLVLQIGLNMAVPIPDLDVSDTAITCTLSFGGRGQYCVIPWESVYAMVSEGETGKGMVWPNDLPPEMLKQPNAGPPAKEKSVRAKAVKKESSETSDRPEPKAKRSRRKESEVPAPEGIRHKLVAVPARVHTSESDPTAEAPLEEAKEIVTEQRPETPPPPAQRFARPSPGQKPKRELPPYLRVVK